MVDFRVIDAEEVCSTQHCKDTVKDWLKCRLCTDEATEACQSNDALDALWTQVLIANDHPTGEVDYDACLEALGGNLADEFSF